MHVPARWSLMMQSPPGNGNDRLELVRLCASIKYTLEQYSKTHSRLTESDVEPFRLEVQTLHRFLELFGRVQQSAEAHKLRPEDNHLRDVEQLLHRCQRTLLNLHAVLVRVRAQAPETEAHEEPWDFRGLTFRVPRAQISFYTRTLEMSLVSINLHTQTLRESVMQRRTFFGGSDHEESVEEMGLLRDVEQCVRSAEDIRSIPSPVMDDDGQSSSSSLRRLTEAQVDHWQSASPPWSGPLSLRNGSIAPSQSNSRTDDPPSDPSEAESIPDPEPDMDEGFTADVYSTIIADLQQELQRKMESREYDEAERTYRTIVRHCTDRETKHKIRFDNRSELSERLAEIYLNQQRYQRAKKILGQLIQEPSSDKDRKARLYLALATAYYGLKRWAKAFSSAQRSLNGREELYGRNHDLTQQAAMLVINIYDAQGERGTANALRNIYCPSTLPPPPPKSALRSTPRRKTPSPPRSPQLPPQSPGDLEEQLHGENHVRWAPDVWTNDAPINQINKSGRTWLIDTIYHGDEEYVKTLIKKKGASVETPCVDTIPPLMHAVTHGHRGIVKILLDHGAQVDLPTSGWSPLHRATEAGDLAMMRLLLAQSANIEFKSPFEFKPPKSRQARYRAIANDESDGEVETASSSDQGWTPLLRAAFKGDEAAVRLLLDHDADIEARNPTKATPLMCACENLHFSTVDLLLMRGANAHASDEFGWRPLHHALVNRSKNGSNQIAPRLLDQEADINARCHFRKTPLHYAIEKNDSAMVIFLLHHNADIEARDIAERTPLHTAIDYRHESMVRLLLDYGADAAAMDKAGNDASAAAKHAERKSPEIISLLADHKKKLKRENSEAAKGRGQKISTFMQTRRGSTPVGVGMAVPSSSASPVGGGGTLKKPEKEKTGWFGSKGKGKVDKTK
ncbi:MAG: hypothetical protein Q9181_002459 [Wetmoreana brouardii]